jgi:hypothetical protein
MCIFSGDLPFNALAGMARLSYLNLRSNRLRGNATDLPLLQLKQLRYLNLRDNLLWGGLPLPGNGNHSQSHRPTKSLPLSVDHGLLCRIITPARSGPSGHPAAGLGAPGSLS